MALHLISAASYLGLSLLSAHVERGVVEVRVDIQIMDSLANVPVLVDAGDSVIDPCLVLVVFRLRIEVELLFVVVEAALEVVDEVLVVPVEVVALVVVSSPVLARVVVPVPVFVPASSLSGFVVAPVAVVVRVMAVGVGAVGSKGGGKGSSSAGAGASSACLFFLFRVCIFGIPPLDIRLVQVSKQVNNK